MPLPDIESIRREIPALNGRIYMNTGSHGPLPRSVVAEVSGDYHAALDDGVEDPAIRERTRTKFEGCRRTVADFFGANTEEIALIRAVSEGLSIVAFGMDWTAGDEVIVTEQEHCSGISIWLNLAQRLGITVRKLALSEDPDEMLSGLDALISERTRLVSVSHVTMDTGHRLPAARVSQLAHDRGVPVAFDGVQAAGQFPIDLREIDADFYAFGGYKWLLGGWGASSLYVKREWVEQLNVSWTGVFAGVWDRRSDELRFPNTARKFEFGGRTYPAYSGMAKGIEFVSSFGTANVEDRVRELTGRLKAAIAEIPGATLRSPGRQETSTGIVTFSVNGLSGEELNRRMWDEWRVLGRPALTQEAMRLSVAFFNDEEEIETVARAIATLAHRAQA